MNYISQLNGFFNSLYTKPLSPIAICLYVALFHINNKCNWKSQFTTANITIQALTGMSRNQVHLARNELIQKGYIEYKKGTGNQCGTYLLVCFDTQIDTQTDTQIDTQTQHKVGPLNKLNKTIYLDLLKKAREKMTGNQFGSKVKATAWAKEQEEWLQLTDEEQMTFITRL